MQHKLKEKSKIVAKNIKSDMAYIGLKRSDMAKACGVSPRTWSRWMSDPDGMTLGTLTVIANTLGAKNPSELWEERKKA